MFTFLCLLGIYGCMNLKQTSEQQKKTAALKERGILAPFAPYEFTMREELEKRYWNGDLSMFPEEYREVCRRNGFWALLYIRGIVEEKMLKDGYCPTVINWGTYDKRTYDPYGEFKRRYNEYKNS